MLYEHNSGPDIALEALVMPHAAAGEFGGGAHPRPRGPLCVHGRAAFATALEDGLMADEVAGILAGRRIVEAFPVRRGESPPHYAARAVAEMMVAYLR